MDTRALEQDGVPGTPADPHAFDLQRAGAAQQGRVEAVPAQELVPPRTQDQPPDHSGRVGQRREALRIRPERQGGQLLSGRLPGCVPLQQRRRSRPVARTHEVG